MAKDSDMHKLIHIMAGWAGALTFFMIGVWVAGLFGSLVIGFFACIVPYAIFLGLSAGLKAESGKAATGPKQADPGPPSGSGRR